MSQSVLILGRQPALGLAEAESLFGADALTPLKPQAVLIEKPPAEMDFNRLGGSTRLCKLLTELPTTNWQEISAFIARELPKHVCCVPEGKIRLGLTVIGKGPSVKTINATGLALKKVVRDTGRSVRVVPNSANELNTAQVLHNQLTGPTGYELVLILREKSTVLAQTVKIQDINAYAARDQKRPKRDARVGMLPPKLAQIIVNLAAGSNPPSNDFTILDPFCGTGVVIQEALLMGYPAYGSDIDQRMVDYSIENVMNWLSIGHPDLPYRGISLGDATTTAWEASESSPSADEVKQVPLHFNTVACETYLGRPFSASPKPEVLAEVMQDVDTIHRKFLQNLAKQTKPGFRACLAVPAWKTKTGFKHLKTLANLSELGYNRLRFVHVDNTELIYHRPDQVVARELVIVQRI